MTLSVVLTAASFILLGLTIPGWVVVSPVVLGIVLVATGVVWLLEGAGVYRPVLWRTAPR